MAWEKHPWCLSKQLPSRETNQLNMVSSLNQLNIANFVDSCGTASPENHRTSSFPPAVVSPLTALNAAECALKLMNGCQSSNSSEESTNAPSESKSDSESSECSSKLRCSVKGVSFQKEYQRWKCTWQANERQHQKYFSAKKLGFDRAMQLAIEWKMKVEKAEQVKPGRRVQDPRRQSGIKGVAFNTANRWYASWYDSGKQRHLYFSVEEYGFELAKQLATIARWEAERTGRLPKRELVLDLYKSSSRMLPKSTEDPSPEIMVLPKSTEALPIIHPEVSPSQLPSTQILSENFGPVNDEVPSDELSSSKDVQNVESSCALRPSGHPTHVVLVCSDPLAETNHS